MQERYSDFKGIQLHYFTMGDPANPAILFIHGYLESAKIWQSFGKLLEKDFFLILPDVPGHGKSGILSSTHHMDEMADALDSVISELNVMKLHLVGHSMGGYIALAYREKYYEKLYSCVLFHSTCYSDTPEKKENRKREINLITEGKKELIINTNIPRAFADDNLDILREEVEFAKKIGRENPDQGIISLLNGMRSRPERCPLLIDDKIPLLLIAGQKDNYIPMEVMEKMLGLGTNVELKILKNSGHMGFMEEPGVSGNILMDFYKKCDGK